MNLNNINDVETLKKLLKYFLMECRSDFSYDGHSFKKGESYLVYQDYEGIDIYDIDCINGKVESKHLVTMDNDTARAILKVDD